MVRGVNLLKIIFVLIGCRLCRLSRGLLFRLLRYIRRLIRSVIRVLRFMYRRLARLRLVWWRLVRLVDGLLIVLESLM